MKLRSLAIVVLIGLAGTAVAAPRRPLPRLTHKKPSKKQLAIEKHEWMAQYYLRRANDLKGAAKEYQAILRLDPKNAGAALALASIYKQSKKGKQAIAVVARLTKKNPKHLAAWHLLAQLQLEAGDVKGFKASLAKALAVDPTDTEAYWLMFHDAHKRYRGGDAAAKDEVLEAARKLKMLERYKSSPSYRLAERAVVELSGDPMELTIYDAKAAYNAAFDTGLMGRINQQMAKARHGFEECTRTTPSNEECHYYLGLIYSSVKASEAYDPKKALAELALATKLPLAYVEAAKLLRAAGKNSDARGRLVKALELDRDLAVAHIELGILDKVAGKLDAAVKHFVAAMDADPWGASGEHALVELTKIKPTHPRVQRGVIMGKGADVFSSDRYKAVVSLIERQLGGVDPEAPEQAVIEDIVRRIADANAIKTTFKVQLVKTKMINAFALADGHIYVTRGLLDMMKKKFPNRAIDARHDALAHILAHEIAHVVRRHTLTTSVFQEAIKDTRRRLDPAVLTHVTRTHEIDADREGIVMAFLAGYKPRGGIEFMEVMGQEREIPKHLDHPTFQERVEYLSEYWTNDVRYAFVSFKLGVAALDRGAKVEARNGEQAIASYQEAIEHFKKFRATLPTLKEAMNDLGVAYTRLGVLAMGKKATPLGRWQSRYSLERDTAVKYKNLVGAEKQRRTRGAVRKRIPWQLREAISSYKEALAADEDYAKARLNLALTYVAANQLTNARDTLAKLPAGADTELVRGIVLAETRQYDKARAAFLKAIRSQTAKRAASYNLARTLELAGKKAEAKRAYLQYVRLYPGGAWAEAAKAAAKKL